MTPDIPSLIHKLRNAPQLVGTFGRGDPDPLDEYRPGMTGEERDWLVKLLEAIERRRGYEEALWDAIRGCAPDATGELSSEDFIREMRDEEWG
jgi:hypothetical protein